MFLLDFLKSYQGLAVTVVKKVKDSDENINKDIDVTHASDDSKKTEPTSTATFNCKLLPKEDTAESTVVSSMFLPENWRLSLCTCPSCTTLYKDLKVEFLTDVKDTVQFYESQSKTEKKNTMEHGMEALSRMDRIKQVTFYQSHILFELKLHYDQANVQYKMELSGEHFITTGTVYIGFIPESFNDAPRT